jgi:hypothetical protein
VGDECLKNTSTVKKSIQANPVQGTEVVEYCAVVYPRTLAPHTMGTFGEWASDSPTKVLVG